MNIEPEKSRDGLDAWLDKIERTRTSTCPQCRSERVKRIACGLPMRDDPTPVEERDYVLGGCILDLDSPGWHCGACGHRW